MASSQSQQQQQAIKKTVLSDRYLIGEELGRGAFGCILLARNAGTGEHVAVKLIERASLSRYIESEILNHSMLRHPHVVQFREVFLSPKHINIVVG